MVCRTDRLCLREEGLRTEEELELLQKLLQLEDEQREGLESTDESGEEDKEGENETGEEATDDTMDWSSDCDG